MTREPRFRKAEWRRLAMLNYEIDPSLLAGYMPAGCELDSWAGHTFVSVVGFEFLHTRVLGASIPFHRHFEEVNLRFYVRRKVEGTWRRGVVFVKESFPGGRSLGSHVASTGKTTSPFPCAICRMGMQT